jgi:hypothetical protein
MATIRVAKQAARAGVVQVATRISPELAKQLRVYAVTHDLRVQDIVEAGIRAAIGEKPAA